MSQKSVNNMIHKLAKNGHYVSAGTAGILLLNFLVNIVLRNGILGQTSPWTMLAIVVFFILASLAMLASLVILCIKKNSQRYGIWLL